MIIFHRGIFAGGLAQNTPRLLKTKYYSFLSDQHNFQMHEVVYAEASRETSYVDNLSEQVTIALPIFFSPLLQETYNAIATHIGKQLALSVTSEVES